MEMNYSFSTQTDRRVGENFMFIIGRHTRHFTATRLMASAVIAMHAGARMVSIYSLPFRINVKELAPLLCFITCFIGRARALNPPRFHYPKDFSKNEEK